MRRTALGARSAFGIGGVLVALRWAAGSPAREMHVVCGQAAFDRALVAALGLIAWACALWFAAVVAALALAAGHGAAARRGADIARRLSPSFVRTAAGWIVGATLIAGPVGASPAFAASPSPSQAPNLDRPVASAFLVVDPSASNPAGPSRTGPSGYPTNIALDLDRPVAPYLPPPPVAPKAKAPTGNAALLGGSAHREAPDDSYVVRRGDTLWAVAARHLGPSATAADVAREWPRWYAANRAVIGTDPHLILPGTVLHAPAG